MIFQAMNNLARASQGWRRRREDKRQREIHKVRFQRPTGVKSILFVILSLLFGCSRPSDSTHSTAATKQPADNLPVPQQELIIDSFSDFPPEIEGCSCYFSSDSIEFSKHQFVYVDDNDQTAFVKVNGKLLKFTQTKFSKRGESNWEETYMNGDYELSIEVRELSQNGDETWLYTGTLRLTDQNNRTVTQNFYGECGC